jgi:serine/threonine-protein kinase
MASVFVSYRRKPSAILAQLIMKDLKAQGIEVYLDIERMEGAGAFPTRLFQAIEASDVFLCLLGDETLESEWVQNEIQHAHEIGKPMIPVFQESYTPIPLDQVPTQHIKALLEFDGVYIFDVKNVYVPQAVEALARMIENTAAWAKQRTPGTPDPSQVPILSVNIEALTGQQFGQYEIRDLLGIGGMSAVYKAHQASLLRDVAIKVLPPSFASQPKALERFLREARTAAALEHAHIVPVYDYGNYGGLSFVVMRLLAGGTLAQRLALAEETNSPLPSLQEVSDMLKPLAGALDYAHSRGVIHRDIKANNVMFDDQGSPYLVDFGIAKLTSATNVLTGTGIAMGTPLYMSPEQWRGESVTPASDQYALGVTTYAMVTGHLPFEAPTPYALMNKHLNEQPPPPETWRADLPESVKKVLEQVMAKRPQNRFASAQEFAQAFAAAVAESGVENQHTEFFTAPLPNRPTPTVSPLVEGTPDPAAAAILQASVQPMASGTPPAVAAHPLTPSALNPPTPPPVTNPAPYQGGSQTPHPNTPQIGAPQPAYNQQSTPTGQPIITQHPTPMDQAQMFVPSTLGLHHAMRWIVPTIVVLALVGVIGLVIMGQNRQAIVMIQQTQDAVNATSLALEIQLTVSNAAQTAVAELVTATKAATSTPTATASPTPATPVVQAINDVAARGGPSADYPIVATLAAEGQLDVVGISDDGGWYEVILPDGTHGWIVNSESLVNAFGDIEHLNTSVPPTSTTAPQTPTATPEPTLRAGGQARVLAGEFGLSMYQDAGNASALVVNLPNQTLVEIVAGPEEIEGTPWWKVTSPEGQTGWVAAETDGQMSLVAVA